MRRRRVFIRVTQYTGYRYRIDSRHLSAHGKLRHQRQ